MRGSQSWTPRALCRETRPPQWLRFPSRLRTPVRRKAFPQGTRASRQGRGTGVDALYSASRRVPGGLRCRVEHKEFKKLVGIQIFIGSYETTLLFPLPLSHFKRCYKKPTLSAIPHLPQRSNFLFSLPLIASVLVLPALYQRGCHPYPSLQSAYPAIQNDLLLRECDRDE